MLNWNLHSFQLLEIIQVLDSISWVRCATGNVYNTTFTNNRGWLVVVVLVVSGVLTKVLEFPKAKVVTELQVLRNAFLSGLDAQM